MGHASIRRVIRVLFAALIRYLPDELDGAVKNLRLSIHIVPIEQNLNRDT